MQFAWALKRLVFPGYREADTSSAIADKLKAYSDGQDVVIETLRQTRELQLNEIIKLQGLNRDLEHQVLELEISVQQLQTQRRADVVDLEVSQTNYVQLRNLYRGADEDRARLKVELRRRATEIRELKGIPVRKRK
jgi:hypothetical protein